MNLHEYQAKDLFRQVGIPVPDGVVAKDLGEVRSRAVVLDPKRWVVKAQVHTGGRGKAGGVMLVDSLDQLEAEARRLIGSRLVTKQTGPEGLPINSILIEATTAIQRELYLAVLIDRTARRILFMASTEGGMNIEEVAAVTPEKILNAYINPVVGLQPYQCRGIGYALGLEGKQVGILQHIMQGLYTLVLKKDASLIEINPLVITEQGELLALDAKINLDDNALYRHPRLKMQRDISQEDPREAAAAEHELNYISLEGTIGCMVNGAGLAMATMDLVKLHGGMPANFLDVGGSTTAERVTEAFKLILSDPQVRAVLVNIFGGIVRCDLIAEGIIMAVKEVGIRVPVVVRLEGTNAAKGSKILDESGLNLTTAGDLTHAAQRVIELAAT